MFQIGKLCRKSPKFGLQTPSGSWWTRTMSWYISRSQKNLRSKIYILIWQILPFPSSTLWILCTWSIYLSYQWANFSSLTEYMSCYNFQYSIFHCFVPYSRDYWIVLFFTFITMVKVESWQGCSEGFRTYSRLHGHSLDCNIHHK